MRIIKRDVPHILFVNPWVHDFAAYDFWAKPLGLLILISILRYHGYAVTYIDCLNRFHPKENPSDPFAKYGRGNFRKTKIPKPSGLEDVSRTFSRYGIEPEWFKEDLLLVPQPDIIAVTSIMTYWYPGVQETIRIIKEQFPDVVLILGGIYATLCREHAEKHSGADIVVAGSDLNHILGLIDKLTGFSGINLNSSFSDILPAFDLQTKVNYIPMLTSTGCPFSCPYCASYFLNPEPMQRQPESVFQEIAYWHKAYGVKDFVFYDDALLANAEHHIIPILEMVIASGINVRFHTPNAVHIRWITKKLAKLMYKAGFTTLRMGLETALFKGRYDRKVTASEFCRAVSHLKAAGFLKDQIGAYLLAGLPGQDIETVADSIKIVKENGVTPIPAYYSPIPHTALWEKAKKSSRYDLDLDPVFSNNAIFPCCLEKFSWDKFLYLRRILET